MAQIESELAVASHISGVPLPAIQAAPGMLKGMASLMRVVERLLPLPETYTYEGLRVIAGVTYLGDNRKARQELGFEPRPLAEGLRQTLEYEMARLRGEHV